MKEAGITSPSKKSIQLILGTIKIYPSNAALETFNNSPIQKKKKDLQSLLKVLEKAIEIIDDMSAPILILPDATRTDWLITTDKIIKDIKRQMDIIDKIKCRAGRKKQFMRMLLVDSLIRIFEKEAGKSFIVEYDTYRDVDRREFDKSGMTFLSDIMRLVYSKLTDDNLRKDIARALKDREELERELKRIGYPLIL